MSEYIMYRCDWCDFEDSDPSFLVDETGKGEDLCADCAEEQKGAGADRATGEGEE